MPAEAGPFLSLSRILGGSMLGQPTAHLITDVELNRLVRDLLHTVPPRESCISESHVPASFAVLSPSRHHARSMHSGIRGTAEPDPCDIDLEPAISVITERAQALTRATGAAIALRRGEEMSVARVPVVPLLTSAFACKPPREFPASACAPAKW